MNEGSTRLIGVIGKAKGLQGEVHLRTQIPFDFLRLSTIFVKNNPYKVKKLSRDFILSLENIDSRESAESLRGEKVFIDNNELIVPTGFYFYTDLIGRVVHTPDGQKLGVVHDIIDTGQDVLVIKNGAEHLVPLQADYVTILEKTIQIEPIEGLFE